jgi:AraC-like DNA-binding protein
MIIDFFDFHATLHGNVKITSQYADLMERFMALLSRGDYKKNRELTYYADKLFVTPKYLSEVCKKVSGFPANYWINRYTILDISRQLRNRKQTLAALADAYNFSSTSYFCRYVQKYLGVKPSDLRE